MSEVEAAVMLQQMIEKHFQVTSECIKRVIALSARSVPDSDRRDAYSALAQATANYLGFLPDAQKPIWLQQIDHAVRRASAGQLNQESGFQLAETIAKNYHLINRIQLKLSTSTSRFNFDEIFTELKRSHKLPEVFDKLANELLEILATNEIDSKAITSVLEQMIEILKANRDGSAVAMKGSVTTARLGWNITREFLKAYVPGVQPIADGIERTLEECESKLSEIEKDFNHQVLVGLRDSVKSLETVQERMAKDVAYISECLKAGRILVIDGACTAVPGALSQQLGTVPNIDHSKSESCTPRELE